MKKILPLLLLLIVAFASCEKLLMPKKPSVKASAIFEEVWSTLDKGYVYFGKKEINWDSLKIVYQGNFVDSIKDQQIYDSLVVMLNTVFQDGNIVLNSGFAMSRYTEVGRYSLNFRKDILERNYWVGYEQTGPLIYKVIDSVGYIYYGSFNEVVNEQQIQVVINRLKGNGGKKGVILDIRNNEGGNPDNMDVFFNHFGADSSTGYDYSAFLYEIAHKNGPHHDDLGNYKGYFKDKNDNLKFGRRVLVLTNRAVYGTASVFASAAMGFGNVETMGDTTGGGGSITSTFELANGWLLTYPSGKIRSGEGGDLADPVGPNIVVQMTQAGQDAGKDDILEAALKEIHDK